MSEIQTGGCRCRAIRFTASEAPDHISYCHCSDCRKASGAPVSAFVGFRADSVVIEGDTLRRFENGPVMRSFCGICGSPIAYTDDRLAGAIYLMLGAMDAPEQFKPTVHAYVREQLAYVHMPDGLPRLPGSSIARPQTD